MIKQAAWVACCWLVVATAAWTAETPAKKLADLEIELKTPLSDAHADSIVKLFQQRYPKKTDWSKGSPSPWIESNAIEAHVGWMIAAPAEVVAKVIAADGRKWDMMALGKTGFQAMVVKLPNFQFSEYAFDVGGKKTGGGTLRVEHFDLSADSLPKEGVPTGKVIEMPVWKSTIYAGTERKWSVYVPSQYDASKPAAVMVFQDGEGYTKGPGAAPVVFDNLIYQEKLPVIIGIFVQPGVFPSNDPKKQPGSNRSNEYDTCTPKYAEFIEKEILAEVAKSYNLTNDPEQRGICGGSSGASCAFTAAWHRPDLFRKVLSTIGSYCDFRPIEKYPTLDGKVKPDPNDYGTWKVAHDYPALIRKTKPIKPIRIFLQDGNRDLDNQLGNWFLANQQMVEALEFSGYPHRFIWGGGFHSRNHEKAILPEALVWLWEK